MTRPPIVDTHVHFWDRERFRYPWLEADEWAAIGSNYLPGDLIAEMASLDVQGIVHVQAEIDHRIDPVEETGWLAALVVAAPDEFPDMACIGFADLGSPDLDDTLARHRGFDLLVGIRQEAWFDPDSTLPGVLTENPLSDPTWVAGLGRLIDHNLLFELLVAADQLHQAGDVFRLLPDLPVILEHTGVPVLERGAPPATWRDGMRRFADEVPRSVLKISGMSFVSPTWTLPDIRPIIRESIEIFGVERCMFGSNFPVDRPASSYRRLWDAFDTATSDLTAAERTALFSGTAQRVYGLGS